MGRIWIQQATAEIAWNSVKLCQWFRRGEQTLRPGLMSSVEVELWRSGDGRIVCFSVAYGGDARDVCASPYAPYQLRVNCACDCEAGCSTGISTWR